MRILRRFAALPDPGRAGGTAYAIGTFDGVHAGHRAVVERARELALELGARFGVVTFEPHPRELLSPEAAPPRLTRFRLKAAIFRDLGVETLVVLPFDRALMTVPAEAFVKSILQQRLGAIAVATGQDFRFGHRRAGDVHLLAEVASGLGIAVAAVAPVHLDGVRCSSTTIRGLVAEGEVARAGRLLGRHYAVDGIVVGGDRRGRPARARAWWRG